METDRLVVPCCGDPEGDSPEAQFVDRLVYGKAYEKGEEFFFVVTATILTVLIIIK